MKVWVRTSKGTQDRPRRNWQRARESQERGMKEYMKSRGHSKSQPQHAKKGNDGRKWDEEERCFSELMVIT